MLKMKCPHCEKFIISKLLAETDKITCEHCQETVPVQDVLVYAKGFTFHRNDLAKRLYRYKSLLNEVIKERETLELNTKASEDSKKSLDQFLDALKEVMSGARDSLRLEFSSHVPVRFCINQQFYSGSLVNLSTTGACIGTKDTASLPQKKSSISLRFSLPDRKEPFSLKGIVIWASKNEVTNKQTYEIGVEFKSLDKDVMQALWEFISHSVAS